MGGVQGGALVVRVSARSVDGNATAAALVAVASAFGAPPSAVTLVLGAARPMKIVHVAGADGLIWKGCWRRDKRAPSGLGTGLTGQPES
jgi:uncharacterized protein YggU (UPF0235/DUF167 family)